MKKYFSGAVIRTILHGLEDGESVYIRRRASREENAEVNAFIMGSSDEDRND